MDETDRFVIAPDVIHEVFEDEVIIADLSRGTYYCLDGAGIDVWTGLQHGVSVGRIVAGLAQSCGVDEGPVAAGVRQLIDDLATEALIRPPNGEVAPTPPAQLTIASTTYRPPTFQKFTDMESILLLDPIHDVSESGWPHDREQS